MNNPSRRLTQIHHERRQKLIGQAAFVGALAGLVAVFFELAVRWTEHFSQGLVDATGQFAWIIVPLFAALLGGTASHFTQKLAPEAAGSGIPHTKLVLMNLRKIVPARLIPVKVGGGLLAIASGMSLGREGPTVQIGAALGQLVAQILKAPRRSYAPLIASGSGAGLAAAFNAPLAGFLFVMEELKREMSPLTYGTALVASVAAVAVKRLILGQTPTFILQQANFVPLPALLVVIVLGVLGGLLGIVFNKGILKALDFRDKINLPRFVYGGLVGLFAGICLVFIPAATGGGHATAEKLLKGTFESPHLLAFLATILLFKFFLTIFSFSSGNPGGIFAPILVLGAVLGYGVGTVANGLFPTLGVVPSVFAAIGMAAVLASTVRAPLTGVVLIFEMTAEYRLLFALLLGAFIAYIIAESLKDHPIYEALLDRELRVNDQSLPDSDPPKVVDLLVEPDSAMDGKRLRELDLPSGCLVVNIQRGKQFVVPNGATRLNEGDVVTIVSEVTDQNDWANVFTLARTPHH
ncbi:MAG: H(+)/Cl(-) exchange transporter ClcA [Fimbriimonadaceae bacterium]